MAPNILGNTLLLAETSIEKSSYDPDTKSPVKLSTDYEPSLSSNITKKRDTSCKKNSSYGFNKDDIVLRNVIIFLYLHIAALYGLYLLISGRAYLVTFLVTYAYGSLGAFGITAGAHRLWAHRAYKATWQLRLILMLCNLIAFQNSIFEWVRDHRVHHKFTDTNADPHNSRRGFFFSHMGWLMIKKHPDVKGKGIAVDMSDMEKDEIVMFQKKYYLWLMPLFCFVIPTLIPYFAFGDSFSACWYIGSALRYTLTLHFTWLVNSAAHIWGMKPYDRNISPTNNVWVSIAAYGEGWHNYHHVFPWDYKTAELGDYSLNFSTAFIDFFSKFGWAYDMKTVSEDIIRKRAARTGDGTNGYSACIKLTDDEKRLEINNQNCSNIINNDEDHNNNINNKLTKTRMNENDDDDDGDDHHHHHHHHSDENLVWGWDDVNIDQFDKTHALRINKCE